ncbi:hypothetical protein [Sphingomonas soli]|uniref:hypothetical protein n=1 Tax=Sphingomonas soli TaxID=266127 RepID=UPI00083787D7|nr:hypothetical protein [Sphingomonas soli]
MESETQAATRPVASRMADFFDRAEEVYLRVLRATVLIIATLLILYTFYLAVAGLYRIAQSPASVKEAVANVTASEIVDAEDVSTKAAEGDGSPAVDAARQKYYADFVKRYYALFRTKFEPFRQPEDKTLSSDEFDDNFVKSAQRLRAVTSGELDFEKDQSDLEALLATMSTASGEPKAAERLRRYRSAKKVAVQREVRRTRTEYRRGWNTYSTACEGWYYSPMGCAENRAVEVPYTDTVTAMEFPKGTQSHSQIFRAMQDRYFTLLEERRRSNAADAELKRMQIMDGNVQGHVDLATALRIFGGFLALMFFFLLIAIERHQRRIAAVLPVTDEDEGTPPA